MRRLINVVQQARRSFTALSKPTQHWDEWLAFLLTEKLDRSTRLDWERSLAASTESPSLRSSFDYLENRQQALSSIQPLSGVQPAFQHISRPATSDVQPRRLFRAVCTVETRTRNAQFSRCPQCSQAHFMRRWPQFLSSCCLRLSSCYLAPAALVRLVLSWIRARR